MQKQTSPIALKVLLEGQLFDRMIGDPGADFSVFPRYVVREVQAHGAKRIRDELDEAIPLTGIYQDST